MAPHVSAQPSLHGSFSTLHGRSQVARHVPRRGAHLPRCSQKRPLTSHTEGHDASIHDQVALLMTERKQSQQAASTSGRGMEALGTWPAASAPCHSAQRGHRQGEKDTTRPPKPEALRSSSHDGELAGRRGTQKAAARPAQAGGRGRQASGRSARQPGYTSVHISSFLEERARGAFGKVAEDALAAACLGAAKAGLGSEAVALLRQMKPGVMLTDHRVVHALIRVRPCLSDGWHAVSGAAQAAQRV